MQNALHIVLQSGGGPYLATNLWSSIELLNVINFMLYGAKSTKSLAFTFGELPMELRHIGRVMVNCCVGSYQLIAV